MFTETDITLVFFGLAVIMTVAFYFGRATKTVKRGTSIADIEQNAINQIAGIFWSKDVTDEQFANKCREIREDAKDAKSLIERCTLKSIKI